MDTCPKTIFTTLSFYVTYKRPNKIECYITLGWKGLSRNQYSSLLGPFISYKEYKVLDKQKNNNQASLVSCWT
jgi:hypothetical protein